MLRMRWWTFGWVNRGWGDDDELVMGVGCDTLLISSLILNTSYFDSVNTPSSSPTATPRPHNSLVNSWHSTCHLTITLFNFLFSIFYIGTQIIKVSRKICNNYQKPITGSMYGTVLNPDDIIFSCKLEVVVCYALSSCCKIFIWIHMFHSGLNVHQF